MNTTAVTDYIKSNWERSIYRDADGSGFRGIDLPHPYTSPSIKGEGHFSFFFYWDTYFTNTGLLRHGHAAVARDNIRNIFWLIDRHGFMPNHVGLENRSQPPYLCRMVREYVETTGDRDLLREAAEYLRREYHFWATARHTPVGLQRYSHQDTAEGCEDFFAMERILRLGYNADAPTEERWRVGGHFLAEAETGWDFTQRFSARCNDFCAVDLNGLLFDYENWLSEVSEELEWGDAALWKERADNRVRRVNEYLWNEEQGWFFDYDFVNGQQSEVYALAGMLPLFTGLANAHQAAKVRDNLPRLEREFGLAATDERPNCRNYQWAYPNVWPPLVYVTVESLRRYGFREDAARIAGKFVDTTVRLFEETGRLWEKTDAETGKVAGSEYDAAPMMGWTAGTFLACLDIMNE